MAGFLTGVTRSPFTAAILVLEMTNDNTIMFHLMATVLIANLSANFINRHSFYDHLKIENIHDISQQSVQSPEA
jgi:H+/Cl- antiporter ClcA